jgi:hypothetical protein
LGKKQNFVLFVIGKKRSLNKLFFDVKAHLKINFISVKNSNFLKKEFKISIKQLESVTTVTPLEDLLVEKAATLFR